MESRGEKAKAQAQAKPNASLATIVTQMGLGKKGLGKNGLTTKDPQNRKTSRKISGIY